MAVDLVAGVVIAVWVITVVLIVVGIVLSVSFPTNDDDEDDGPVSTINDSGRTGTQRETGAQRTCACLLRFEHETTRAWDVRQRVYSALCDSYYTLGVEDTPGLGHLPYAFVEEALFFLGPALSEPQDIVFRGSRFYVPATGEWLRRMAAETKPECLTFLCAEQHNEQWLLGDHVCATGRTWQTLWGAATAADVARVVSEWFEEGGFDLMTPTRKFHDAVQDHTRGVFTVRSLLPTVLDRRRCGREAICHTAEDNIGEFHDFELPEDIGRGCWDHIGRIVRVIVHDAAQ